MPTSFAYVVFDSGRCLLIFTLVVLLTTCTVVFVPSVHHIHLIHPSIYDTRAPSTLDLAAILFQDLNLTHSQFFPPAHLHTNSTFIPPFALVLVISVSAHYFACMYTSGLMHSTFV